MPSLHTSYTCPACQKTLAVEVKGLGDPYEHIPERSREVMRRVRETENKLGQDKPGDPVEELAQSLLEQEARSVLLHATCPECNAKNPAGIADDRKEHTHTVLFGCIPLGIIAVAAWFYSWVALIILGASLLVFRPLMVLQWRKLREKPFPYGRFIAGILIDIGLVVATLKFPIVAPGVPLVGLVQTILSGTSKYEWKWEDAQKKLRFGAQENAVT